MARHIDRMFNNLSSPGWRSARAEMELTSEAIKQGLLPESNDALVIKYKQYRNLRRSLKRPPEAFKYLTYPFSLVDEISQECYPSCMRHALEAAVLGQATNNWIRENIHPVLSDPIIELFCALFFDVKKRLDTAIWIERYVLAPARSTKGDELRLSVYDWKMAALVARDHSKFDEFTKTIKTTYVYKAEDYEWVKARASSEIARKVLQQASLGDRLPIEIRAPQREKAALTWLDRDTGGGRQMPPQFSSALENSGMVGSGAPIALIEPSDTPPPAEERYEGKIKTYS